MAIAIKRIYDSVDPDDGKRVLVDRLWPRGVSKEKARLDLWLKNIAPSPQLRTWFGHSQARFEDFSNQYLAELANDPEKILATNELLNMAKKGKISLLYGAKSPSVNHAIVLKNYLDKLSKNK